MRHRTRVLPVGILLLTVLLMRRPAVAQTVDSSPKLTAAILDQWMEDLSNWGRWGKEDELGTLNLITPEKRRRAAALVTDGVSVSLAFDLAKEANPNNEFPLEHSLRVHENDGGVFAEDTYTIRYHGFAHSHVDALCHIFHQGKMYNGFLRSEVKPSGAEKLGVQHMKQGIFTRGVLVDVPWLKGVPYLEPGTAIRIEDLEAWEQKTGLHVESGDVLLVRTGLYERQRQLGSWNFIQAAAGLHASVATWLKERDVAVVGSDATNEVFPSGIEGVPFPIHQLAVVALGMPLLDNLNLEDLAREAQARNRWEFLFVAAPLRVPGGTGSPVNPLATF